MAALTDYLEEQILNWLTQDTQMPTPPSIVYIALHTGDPTESGDANEISAGGYTRQATDAPSDWGIDLSSGSVTNLSSTVEFAAATEDWGEVSHFSIWDGDTDTDNALIYGSLQEARIINTGDQFRFSADNLSIEMD